MRQIRATLAVAFTIPEQGMDYIALQKALQHLVIPNHVFSMEVDIIALWADGAEVSRAVRGAAPPIPRRKKAP